MARYGLKWLETEETAGNRLKLIKMTMLMLGNQMGWPCDKGARVIILDFEEYMRACNEHLEWEKVNTDGNATRYYFEVNEEILEQAKNKILNVIEEGLDNRIISKSEFEVMHPIAKMWENFIAISKFTKNT